MPQLSEQLVGSILDGSIPLPSTFDGVEENYKQQLLAEYSSAFSENSRKNFNKIIDRICRTHKTFTLIDFPSEIWHIIDDEINAHLKSNCVLESICIKNPPGKSWIVSPQYDSESFSDDDEEDNARVEAIIENPGLLEEGHDENYFPNPVNTSPAHSSPVDTDSSKASSLSSDLGAGNNENETLSASEEFEMLPPLEDIIGADSIALYHQSPVFATSQSVILEKKQPRLQPPKPPPGFDDDDYNHPLSQSAPLLTCYTPFFFRAPPQEVIHIRAVSPNPIVHTAPTLERALSDENFSSPEAEESLNESVLLQAQRYEELIKKFEDYFFQEARENNYIWMRETKQFPELEDINPADPAAPALTRSLTLPKSTNTPQNTLDLLKKYYPMLLEIIEYYKVKVQTLSEGLTRSRKSPLRSSSSLTNSISAERNSYQGKLTTAVQWRETLRKELVSLQHEAADLRRSQLLESQLKSSWHAEEKEIPLRIFSSTPAIPTDVSKQSVQPLATQSSLPLNKNFGM